MLQNRRDIATLLKSSVYTQAALVPATPWLGAQAPRAPRLSFKQAGGHGMPDTVLIEPEDDSILRQFAIWKRYGSRWVFTVQPASMTQVALDADAKLGQADALVVSSVNRLGIESTRAAVQLPPWRPIP